MIRKIILAAVIGAFAIISGADARVVGAQDLVPAPAIGEPAAIEPSGDKASNDAGLLGLDYSGCGGVNAPAVNAAYEQEVIERTNLERLNNGGLPPLKRVSSLDNAGRYHGTDMAQDNYFNHDSYDRSGGSLLLSCGWVTRVAGYYGSYVALSENIAAGQLTPQAVMSSWMGSSGHRANILSSSVWEIGVGYYCCGGTYSRYWVQDFGKKSGVYPLIINREAASTTSAAVNLYLYGTFAERRLRNDSGAWGAWQPFNNNVAWILPATNGVHTVSAEMRTGGTTYSSSDTIELVGGGPPPPTGTAPPPTPGPTATSGGSQFSFVASHDAYVYSGVPGGNYGFSTALAMRGGTTSLYRTFAKFVVTGLGAVPSSAKIRMYAYDGSSSGGSAYGVSNNYAGSTAPWVENAITWSNSPVISGVPLGTAGTVPPGTWVEYTVTPAITGNGTFSFGLTSASSDLVAFHSRQASTKRPVLVITQ